MNAGAPGNSGARGFGQFMVDQRPRFDNAMRRKRKGSSNQVMSKSGIIRPDKRKKAKYL